VVFPFFLTDRGSDLQRLLLAMAAEAFTRGGAAASFVGDEDPGERLVRGAPCSFGLSATSQHYFSLRTNQPPTTSQQYFSLRTNQHQPSATSQTNRSEVGKGVRGGSRLVVYRPRGRGGARDRAAASRWGRKPGRQEGRGKGRLLTSGPELAVGEKGQGIFAQAAQAGAVLVGKWKGATPPGLPLVGP
jgi:hypothetical protein